MNIIERTLNDVTVLDLNGNLASEGAGLPPSEKGGAGAIRSCGRILAG
jgi:hypothetical protein